MLTKNTVRIYANQTTDKYNTDEWIVEYANPNFFNSPKRTVDYVDTDRPHIIEAYKRVGIDLSPLCSTDAPEELENVSQEPTDSSEVTPEEDSKEPEGEVIIEADKVVENDLDDDTKAPEDMAWFSLKKHVKETTGKVAKNKKDALAILEEFNNN